MEMIFDIIKLLIITYVLKDLGGFIAELIYEYVKIKKVFIRVLFLILGYVLSCGKCFSFWFVLILSGGNLFMAALISMLMMFIEKIENKYVFL